MIEIILLILVLLLLIGIGIFVGGIQMTGAAGAASNTRSRAVRSHWGRRQWPAARIDLRGRLAPSGLTVYADLWCGAFGLQASYRVPQL